MWKKTTRWTQKRISLALCIAMMLSMAMPIAYAVDGEASVGTTYISEENMNQADNLTGDGTEGGVDPDNTVDPPDVTATPDDGVVGPAETTNPGGTEDPPKETMNPDGAGEAPDETLDPDAAGNDDQGKIEEPVPVMCPTCGGEHEESNCIFFAFSQLQAELPEALQPETMPDETALQEMGRDALLELLAELDAFLAQCGELTASPSVFALLAPDESEEGPAEQADLAEQLAPYDALRARLIDALRAAGPFTGLGTEADPYQITSEADLEKLAQLVNAGDASVSGEDTLVFQLTASITLTKDWTPIGVDKDHAFKGVFDGAGKTIIGLAIGKADALAASAYLGLFGCTESTSVIKNLTVTGSIYSTGNYVGGIVGYSEGAIQNCTFGAEGSSSLVMGTNNIGGVAGYFNYGFSQDAHTVTNHAAVTGINYVGGVYGYMASDETEASHSNSGAVTGVSEVGGIAGRTNADYLNHTATNSGAVSGTSEVGGIVGFTYRSFGSSTYRGDSTSYPIRNNGAVSGETNIGGIVGQADDTFCVSEGSTITNEGTVNGTVQAVGGAIGLLTGSFSGTGYSYKFAGALSNNANIKGLKDVGGIVGQSTGTMISGSNFSGEPMLNNSGAVEGAENVGGIAGNVAGTIISQYLAMTNTAKIEAAGDHAGGIAGYVQGSLTVSSKAMKNTGTVNAVNHAGGIAGFVQSSVSLGSTAVNGGAVTASGENAGGMVGTTVGKITMTGATASNGAVAAKINAGGVVGLSKGGITGGAATALTLGGRIEATDANAGGVAGQLAGPAEAEGTAIVVDKLSLEAANVTGSIVSPSNVGGLIGSATGKVTVQNSYNTVSVTSNGIYGSLAGNAGTDVMLTGCYSHVKNGDTVVSLPLAGGSATVEKSFYLVADDSLDTESGAKKAADFKSGLLAYTLGGKVWGQKMGADDRPYLIATDHPAIYKLTVTQNTELAPLSVKPYAAADAAYLVVDNEAYANTGAEIMLKAETLAQDAGLLFRPLDRVTETAEHGVYTIKLAAEDVKVTYTSAVVVAPDVTWYEGSESAETFTLDSESDIRGLAKLVNEGNTFAGKALQLGADVNLTASLWTPIGTDAYPFSGTFEAAANPGGGYFKITGLNVESTADNWALFGCTDGAVLRNISVSGSVKSTGNNIASIAAVAKATTFEACENKAQLSGKDNVGGIAGQAVDCTFKACVNSADVSGTGTGTGGVAGSAVGGIFEQCYNAAKVAGASEVGGVLGVSAGAAVRLTGCYNAQGGTVSATGANCGGVAGSVGALAVKDCYNAGLVGGAASTGGVIGLTGSATAGALMEAENCSNAASGKVTGAAGTGGVIGKAGNYLTMTGCKNLGEVEGGNYTGGVLGQSGSYTDITGCVNEATVKGGGSATGGVVGALSANGFLSGCYNAESGAVTGTGASTGGVAGTTASMSKAVSGIYNAGEVTGSGTYTGGVVGNLSAPGVTVTDCYNSGMVTGSGTYTGGVFGQLNNARDFVTDCYNQGKVTGTGTYLAGIVGYMPGSWGYLGGTYTRPVRLYNLGAISAESGTTFASGICGYAVAPYSYIGNSFNYGSVTANDAAHVAGITANGFISSENCYYYADQILADTVAATPLDSKYAMGKDAEAFASGEVSYLLDKGGTEERTELWGRGSSYPVPADVNHPALYRMTLSVDGPAAGYEQAPLPEDAPEGTPLPSVNGLSVSDKAAQAGKPLSLYLPSKSDVPATYTLKDGYLLERITTAPPACTAVLDSENGRITFALPAKADGEATVAFGEKPIDGAAQYTVTFDATGGTWDDDAIVRTELVAAGGRVSAPSAPSKDGGALAEITFTGWYTDRECTVKYNFTSAVRGDFTLYAGWRTVGKHTVTFNAGEGVFSGGGKTQANIIASGGRVTAPTAPALDGYTFRGWYLDEAGTRGYDFGNKVTQDLTLYAGWVETGKCVVLFNANGGTITMDDGTQTPVYSVTVSAGEKVTEPAASRENEGDTSFVLDSWKTQNGSSWNFELDAVSESMTLTAVWKDSIFAQPGTYEISDLTALEALRDAVNSGDKKAGSTFVLTADLDLPADWTSIGNESIRGGSKPFNGTFDGNGYTITLNDGQTHPLFGSIGGGVGSSGTVKNLNIVANQVRNISAGIAFDASNGTIENCTVSGNLHSNEALAGIAYYMAGGLVENCTIKAGSVLDGGECVSGIVGISSSGGVLAINNCTVEDGTTITGYGGTNLMGQGGVAGILVYAFGSIDNCYNGATIRATHPGGAKGVGGIVARANTVGSYTVSNCANTGDIYSTGSYTGGIMGQGFPIENCYSTGNIYVTGKDGYVGGLVGNGVSIDNSYWYGSTISVPEGTGNVGAIAGNLSKEITNSYFGIKPKDGVTADVTDPNLDNGLTLLPASDFVSGKAAYLLDTDSGSAEGIWTQNAAKGCPTLGRPTYYPATVSATNGTISIDDKTSEIYLGQGNEVQVAVAPDEYKNEKYGAQYAYVLSSLTVNDEPCEGTAFTMPGKIADVVAVFELKQTGYIDLPPADDDDSKPEKPEKPVTPPVVGGGESGSGTGTGDGAGTGDSGSGSGTGSDVGGGIGDGVTDSTGAGQTGEPSDQPTQNNTAQAVTNDGRNSQAELAVPVISDPLEQEPETEEPEDNEQIPETPEKPVEDENRLEEAPDIQETTQRNILPVIALIAVVAGAALVVLLRLLRTKKTKTPVN